MLFLEAQRTDGVTAGTAGCAAGPRIWGRQCGSILPGQHCIVALLQAMQLTHESPVSTGQERAIRPT